jgi:DNA processing protein
MRPLFVFRLGAVMKTLDLLTLSLLPGVGPRTLRELSLRGPLAGALACPEAHVDLLGDTARARITSGEGKRRAEAEIERAGRLGVRLLGIDETDYPDLLRRVYDPPAVLYVRGSTTGADPGLAVVGSRSASAAGRTCAHTMARDLAAAGLTIVSGLARGIDTAAHEGALAGKGRTVAVLGSALDRVYPRENAGLAARIVDCGGAVVSEFPFGIGPEPGHFPRRNRVIAGWSRAVVVVEAAMRSGALVTARLAAEEGRDVFAMPGHPTQAGSSGTNQLIRDGAALVRDAADVLSELGLDPGLVRPASVPADDLLLQALRDDAPASVDELHARSGRAVSEILGRLAELELASKVRRLPGGFFVRN